MKRNTFTIINTAVVLILCLNAYSQTSESKITEQEKQEAEKFIDSFTQDYVQTFDLMKVSSFFIKNYKQEKFRSFFVEGFDNSLTNDEKLRNYFALLDFFNLVFFTKLDDNNYDLKKTFGGIESNKSDEEESEMFFSSSSKLKFLFQKYPKAKLLFLKKDFSQIKNIDDYRNVMSDYQNIIQEARNSISIEQKNKYLKFITDYKKNFFKIDYSFECSKDDCEGLPEKTKMFWCESIPFYLLIAKENRRLKIVKIQPPTD